MSLVVFSTHPIQYQAPVYRLLQAEFGVPVTAIYGSDFSVSGYHDREFGTDLAWDTDLLAGYRSIFLSHSAQGGARSPEEVSSSGAGTVLKNLTPKAILLTGYRPRFDLGAFLASWRIGCPLLFRAETTDHAFPRALVKGWGRDWFLRWFYRRFSRLLYIGRRSLDHYRRLGIGEQQLIFSPYCVDASTYQADENSRTSLRAQTRSELGLSDEQWVVLFSGKLVSRKGPDLLLEAVKGLMPALRQRVAVVFLGDGDLRSNLRSAAANPPACTVRFAGFQNQHSLSRYYHAADMLAMPSRTGETWGLVVNEALHHGVPCAVSSSVGCAPDLIEAGVTGEIFDAGSTLELAEAIEKIIGWRDVPAVREKCRRKVSSYSLLRAAEGIASAYGQVTGAHSLTGSTE